MDVPAICDPAFRGTRTNCRQGHGIIIVTLSATEARFLRYRDELRVSGRLVFQTTMYWNLPTRPPPPSSECSSLAVIIAGMSLVYHQSSACQNLMTRHPRPAFTVCTHYTSLAVANLAPPPNTNANHLSRMPQRILTPRHSHIHLSLSSPPLPPQTTSPSPSQTSHPQTHHHSLVHHHFSSTQRTKLITTAPYSPISTPKTKKINNPKPITPRCHQDGRMGHNNVDRLDIQKLRFAYATPDTNLGKMRTNSKIDPFLNQRNGKRQRMREMSRGEVKMKMQGIGKENRGKMGRGRRIEREREVEVEVEVEVEIVRT